MRIIYTFEEISKILDNKILSTFRQSISSNNQICYIFDKDLNNDRLTRYSKKGLKKVLLPKTVSDILIKNAKHVFN